MSKWEKNMNIDKQLIVVLDDEKYFNINKCSLLSLSDAGLNCISKHKYFIVKIPNFITNIDDDAFSDCYSLIEVELPDGITRIGNYAFASCTGLTKINIPDSVVSIGEDAFLGCTVLTEITIPKCVSCMGDDEFFPLSPFCECVSLKTIKVDKGNAIFTSQDENGNEINGVIAKSNNALIVGCKNTIIPNSVIEIRKEAFCGCIGLTGIFIPKNIIEIGRLAFSGCTNLKNIYCETKRKPKGWDSNWNSKCNAKIKWGYKN